jgi:hypothetical protein
MLPASRPPRTSPGSCARLAGLAATVFGEDATILEFFFFKKTKTTGVVI